MTPRHFGPALTGFSAQERVSAPASRAPREGDSCRGALPSDARQPARRQPGEMSPASEAVQAQISFGVSLARAGSYGEAAAAFRRALVVDPRSVAAHFNLGVTFAAAGRVDAAVQVFRDALGIAPNVAQLHFSLGAALTHLGDLDQAILSYERAAALEPSLIVLNNLGSALRERGRTDEAIAAFRRALQIDASSALVHLNLGTALEDNGQLEAATRSYERALALDPGLAPAHRALASVLVERDLIDKGFTQFRRFAQLRHERRGIEARRMRTPAQKRKHDREQAGYLCETGTDGSRVPRLREVVALDVVANAAGLSHRGIGSGQNIFLGVGPGAPSRDSSDSSVGGGHRVL